MLLEGRRILHKILNSDLEAKIFTHTDIKEWEAALGEEKQNGKIEVTIICDVVRVQIR